jgi:hypothetical protein
MCRGHSTERTCVAAPPAPSPPPLPNERRSLGRSGGGGNPLRMTLLAFLACATEQGVDSGDACREWDEVVELAVASETSACPEAGELTVDDVNRYEGCDGDELVAVLERVSDVPGACPGWRACSWACTYRATVRSCAAEPTGCWIR